MGEQTLGYCGLYCGGCPYFQGSLAGKPYEAESGETFLCEGCASGKTTPWCADCAIKLCAIAKGYRLCIECADNPCDKMRGFMNDPKYPYHLRVQEDMRRLKAIGLPAWEKEMAGRYKCGACGSTFNWFDKQCPVCGRQTTSSDCE